jgi:hypothetical protein
MSATGCPTDLFVEKRVGERIRWPGLTWVATDDGQQVPLYDALVEVELEESRGCLSFSREWLNYDSAKQKVVLPALPSRVEETYQRVALSVEGTNIGPLPRVTAKTGIGQVVRIRLPTMFATYDVVDLMR